MTMTPADVLKRISGQSMGRIWWEQQKKAATTGQAEGRINIKVFNKGLGPNLDAYRKMVKDGMEFMALQAGLPGNKGKPGKLDARQLAPIRKQRDKVDAIITDYLNTCTNNMNQTRTAANAAQATSAQKAAFTSQSTHL